MLGEVFIIHWPGFLCGGAITALLYIGSNYAAVVNNIIMQKVINSLVQQWIFISLLPALALAWNSRRLELLDTRQEVLELKTQLDSITKPKFSARVERLLLDKTSGIVFANLSIANEGMSSTTEAWEMEININGEIYKGSLPSEIYNKISVEEDGPGGYTDYHYSMDNFLSDSVSPQVMKGSPLKSPMVYMFSKQITAPVLNVTLKCKDYRGEPQVMENVPVEMCYPSELNVYWEN